MFFLGLLLVLASSIGITAQQIYRNREFGIVVPVPAGTLQCRYPGQHDHGPVFLIATMDPGACAELSDKRAVIVFAGPNATDEGKFLPDLLKSLCKTLIKAGCEPPPDGIRLGDRRIEAGMAQGAHGWLDVVVVTQGGMPDPAFDPSVPSINYDIRLHTQRRYLDKDLSVLRTVLQTIQLAAEHRDGARWPSP